MIPQTEWLGPLAWASLYLSDNYFTIACARMYQAQTTIVFEGSYELTPLWQADVNALRAFSRRFLMVLTASTIYVWWVAHVSAAWNMRELYELAIGALVMMQLTIHIRHLRNWFLFRTVLAGAINGRIEYPRRVVLRGSAMELGLFTGLYACLFVVTRDLFVLGGTLACAVLSLSHYRLAQQHEASRAGR